MLGPKGSGKTTIGTTMSERTNAKLIDFNEFLSSNGLEGQDDELVTTSFIKSLSLEVKPRVILENFP
jgi:broad-specificity NMP kinase